MLKELAHWSMTTLRKKLVKIGTKMVRHGRYVTFQMAEVAVSRWIFGQILARIAQLPSCVRRRFDPCRGRRGEESHGERVP